MRRWRPLALVGISFLLVGCQAVAGPNGASTHPTTSTTSASPSTRPSADSSAGLGLFGIRCSASQLAVAPQGGPFSEPTGQHSVALIITNTSTSGCYLSGYPQVAFFDSAGRTLPFQYQTTGDQVVTSAPPEHVDLAPRGRAFVTINKYRCDTTDLMQSSDLRFTGPGATSSWDIAIAGIDYCGPGDPGSIVHISPVEPNFMATLAQ